MDVFFVYFLGVFGCRPVLMLTLPPKSPSSKIICFGVFGMFEMCPVTIDWPELFLEGNDW